jgi:hypothetical protein
MSLVVARTGGLMILVLLAYAVRELRLGAFAMHRQSQRYEDLYYLPRAAWLPTLSLGFHDALADLIWCRSLVYFGEELEHQGAVKFAFEYTDAIIELSPDFKQAYRWASVAAVSRPVAFTLAEGLQGARYLERALERWPQDGELHWDYGSMLRFELAPLLQSGPEKDKLLARAAPHLATAASLGAGPAWLALNSSALLQRLGQSEQAIRHLQEVYPTIQDERTKREVEARLAALRSQSFVEALKTANAEFEQSRQASYPYLTPGLFMLVGAQPMHDWHEAVRQRFLPPAPEASEFGSPEELAAEGARAEEPPHGD